MKGKQNLYIYFVSYSQLFGNWKVGTDYLTLKFEYRPQHVRTLIFCTAIKLKGCCKNFGYLDNHNIFTSAFELSISYIDHFFWSVKSPKSWEKLEGKKRLLALWAHTCALWPRWAVAIFDPGLSLANIQCWNQYCGTSKHISK